MMKFIEKVGNVKVYTKNQGNEIIVIFINGTDIICQELYVNTTEQKAIEDLFIKKFDTYTEEYIYLNCSTDITKLSNNTYRDGENNYFCRINGTRYFKHFNKPASDFITDKNGKRIIDM